MAKNVPSCSRIVTLIVLSGLTFAKINPNGPKCFHMVLNSPNLSQMVANGPKLSHLVPNGPNDSKYLKKHSDMPCILFN